MLLGLHAKSKTKQKKFCLLLLKSLENSVNEQTQKVTRSAPVYYFIVIFQTIPLIVSYAYKNTTYDQLGL